MFFQLFCWWLRNAELELFAAKLFGYGFTMYTSSSFISPDALATLATVCSSMGGLFFVVHYGRKAVAGKKRSGSDFLHLNVSSLQSVITEMAWQVAPCWESA